MTAMETTKVRDLQFSEMFLGHPSLEDRSSDLPGADATPLNAGPVLRNDLQQLARRCSAEFESAPSMADFKLTHDGVMYRVSVMATLEGNVFVLRKMVACVRSLAEIGIPQAYIRPLIAEDLGGLFIIAGTVSSGKLLTACALLRERLRAYGGVAVASRDLMELTVEGDHGPGVCYQSVCPANSSAFVDSFRRSIRAGGRIILIDEISTPQVAAEVLRACGSGHLIISTMMAESVIHAITKLNAVADEALAPGCGRVMIADGLAGVMHQRALKAVNDSPRLETELLLLKEAPQAKAILRNSDFDCLAHEIQRQRTAMIAENASALRAVST
jgi:Tfp pilus assembly pilus retraction ATPase PilT